MKNFVVDYKDTLFLESSDTAALLNRLNWRAEILLTRNREAIEGKRILDLASHDGRFSYACLKLGAKHVTGIEFRDHLVKNTYENFEKLGYDPGQYNFLKGDIFHYLSNFDPSEFDTILCFGFFYHTIRQVELLELIKGLKPQHFILDTMVTKLMFEEMFPVKLLKSLIKAAVFWYARKRLTKMGKSHAGFPDKLTIESIKKDFRTTYLEFNYEDPSVESFTSEESGIVAVPTKKLIELLFNTAGYEFKALQWDKKEINDWFTIEDYKFERRVSYIAQIS
ncbi:MAG: class I SAM-dependent methyltransferase [Candidatus Anammoxibacter sp.]